MSDAKESGETGRTLPESRLKLSEILLREQLQNYRMQRHDFLNHFQVIMGYLQLGKPETALTYIHNALRSLEEEQKAAQIPEPQVCAIITSWLVQLKERGLKVRLETGGLVSEEYWKNNWKQEYAEDFYGYTKRCLKLVGSGLSEGSQARIRLFDDPQGLNCSFELQGESMDLALEVWRN